MDGRSSQLKHFSWKRILTEPISAELTTPLFYGFAIAALQGGSTLLASVLFMFGSIFLLLRVVTWAVSYDKRDRRRALAAVVTAWFLVIVCPAGYFVYLETKPAFVVVWPMGFDSGRQFQYFAVLSSWKPLADVQITLIDNSSALALGEQSELAVHTWKLGEVSSSYLIPNIVWVKPVPLNTQLEDFYLIDLASHEGGNYSEELTLSHLSDGKEGFSMKIYGTKHREVFRCDYSPSVQRITVKTPFGCSSH